MLSNSDFFRGRHLCFIKVILNINVLSTFSSPPSSDNSLPPKAAVSRVCPSRLSRADYFFLICISLYQLAGVF